MSDDEFNYRDEVRVNLARACNHFGSALEAMHRSGFSGNWASVRREFCWMACDVFAAFSWDAASEEP